MDKEFRYMYKNNEDEKIVRVNKYKIHDIDDSGVIRYYGYMNEVGDWYIMKWDSSTGVIRYKRESISNVGLYQSSWDDRINQRYRYWSDSF